MQKRGQVTIIVIIAVVVLMAFAFVYFYSSELVKLKPTSKNTQLRLAETYDAIKKDQIDRCIDSEAKDALKLLIENGGSFAPSNFVVYHGRKIAVLCQAIPGKNTCLNTPLFLNVLEEKLNERLKIKIDACIDLSAYREKDIVIDTGELDVDTSINPGNVAVRVVYPITLRSGVVNITKENFAYNVDVPLGEIVKVVNDVLNSEATLGVFEPLSYGVFSLNRYDVEVKKPYPNKIYIAGLTNSDYKMWFAVTGNSRFNI